MNVDKQKRLKELRHTQRMTGKIDDHRLRSSVGLIDMCRYVNLIGANMIEIGSHIGVSGEIFALHCKQLTLVDKWDLKCQHKEKEQRAENERLTIERLAQYEHVTIHKAFSTEYSCTVDDQSLDFVYIDAGHSFNMFTADLVAWLPKIKPGCYIGGHDYVWPGVRRGLDSILPFLNVVDFKNFRDNSWVFKLG